MKLMTPAQVKEKRGDETARSLIRSQEIEQLADETRRKLARAESEFNETLARNRHEWAKEEEEHANRMKEMEREVSVLENRRTQALIPIEIEKKEADSLLKQSKEFLKKSQEKESLADETLEALENRLDEVKEREMIMQSEESRLEVKKKGIENQEEVTKTGSERLSHALQEFYKKQKEDDRLLAEKNEALLLKEINLNAKEEGQARERHALHVKEMQLNDRQATLERAFKRLDNSLENNDGTGTM